MPKNRIFPLGITRNFGGICVFATQAVIKDNEGGEEAEVPGRRENVKRILIVPAFEFAGCLELLYVWCACRK